jgi:hypothetical protein
MNLRRLILLNKLETLHKTVENGAMYGGRCGTRARELAWTARKLGEKADIYLVESTGDRLLNPPLGLFGPTPFDKGVWYYHEAVLIDDEVWDPNLGVPVLEDGYLDRGFHEATGNEKIKSFSPFNPFERSNFRYMIERLINNSAA